MMTPLLQLLCAGDILSTAQADELTTQVQAQSVSALTAVMASGIISAEALADYLSSQLNLRQIRLEKYPYDEFCRQLNITELALRYQALPVEVSEEWLVLAAGDPSIPQLREDFQFVTGLHIELVLCNADSLQSALKDLRQPKQPSHAAQHQPEAQIREEESHYDSSLSPDDSNPISQYLHQVLYEAWQQKASDIHFEPYEFSYRIRMRLNGILVTTHAPPHNISRRLASHIKVLADLNIAERRLPQDGRIKFSADKKTGIDLRVSVLPAQWGEKIVIRLLNIKTQALEIDHLGYTDHQLHLFRQSIHKPQGMILITGPTGSGKTITLYSALNEINTDSKNISTVEDPVEISLSGINQVQINEKIGLSFSQTLRAMLRQDPDIIMVGEIRDKETATIALRAAQTGHLVFSTLHTNSARATFVRLQQMGFESYLLNSAIRLIVAQRLVRRLCPLCKQPITKPPAISSQLNPGAVIFQANPQGCHACIGGYQGRMGLFEMLLPGAENHPHTGNGVYIVNEMPSKTAPKENNTLWQDGIRKVEQGLTSVEELYRVLESPGSYEDNQ
ncbi:GspE/PulE family protein [Vibrio quintilis]|uniref:Type II secretion system protein E n=1 Tax=Vibrio quintilis TaxID=1117707 RepID=A0A1M7YU22_9VIBR|nr:ATPase, T2SS/T4P/T4SS family [Vibrio quintilis]SHO56092.1 Type II secretion system protein E [Vibrio quintilis]